MKKYIKHAVALLISSGCVYVAFRNVDFSRAMDIFGHGRLRILPLCAFAFLSVAVMWVRGWRWKYLFLPEHQARTWGLTQSNLIGFMSNNILPLRVGEMVRALMARRKSRASLSYVFATLFVERLFDTLTLLLMCLIVPLLFVHTFPKWVKDIGLGMTFVFVGGLGLILLLRSKPHSAQRMLSVPARIILPEHIFERFERGLQKFTEGLRILRNGPAMLKISLLSILHWGIVVFSYYLAFVGFSFDLPWSAPFLTLGVVGVGVALPSAPAFVGPIHAAIIYTLSDAYGVPKSEATGFAVVMHLLMMGPITLIGLLTMWREGLSLHEIRAKAEHVDAELSPGDEGLESRVN